MKKQITVNNHKIDWCENMTIDKILKIMKYSFKMLVIKVNGKLVKRNEYSNFVVPANADVKVIHLISGG